MAALPIWVTILLDRPLTEAEVSALPLPRGFLAWVEDGPIPSSLLDTGASGDPPQKSGVARLHISGGTNELEVGAHQQPAAIRKMAAEMRGNFSVMTKAPGDTTPARIISAAGWKVEELSACLRKLCRMPWAVGIVLPQANHQAFSAREFATETEQYPHHYHFPLYVYTKVRPDPDGPYAVTMGLFLFGLPDIAMPLSPGLEPAEAARLMGLLQNEMVAEGWWPEHGARFTTDGITLAIERVGDGLFVTPTNRQFDPAKLAVARYRFALERVTTRPLAPHTRHRVRTPELVCDHLLDAAGASYAMTVGLSLTPQRGGTAALENDRVELLLETKHIGPWATGWLAWIASAVRENDGKMPLKPWDRVVAPEPEGDLAGVIVWPRGPWSVLGGVVQVWGLVPFLSTELTRFRSAPGEQEAWLKAHASNVPALLDRWSRVST